MRRAMKAAVGVLAGVSLLAGCNWGQPGYDGNNQNSNRAVVNLGPSEAATLHQVWSRSFSDPPLGPVESPGGLVHIAVNPAGVRYAVVEGISERTGATVWHQDVDVFNTDVAHLLWPVMFQGKLFVGALGIGQTDSGTLYDPATGDVLESGLPWGDATVRGDVRVRLADPQVGDFFGHDFDIVPGWSPIKFGETAAYAPVISTSAVYAYVHSVAANRTVLGRFPLSLPSDPTAVCTLESISTNPDSYACDPVVNAPISGSAPVLSTDQQTVYVTTSSTVYALDADDLSTKWTAEVKGGTVGSVTIAGDTLYVATGDSLVAMPAAGCGTSTCSPSWSTLLAGPAVGRPTVADGVAYVVSRPADATDGDVLQAFDLGCGDGCAPVMSTSTGLNVYGSPVVTTRSRVFLTGTAVGIDPSQDEGRLVAYGPA